jgi:hypothetical protein
MLKRVQRDVFLAEPLILLGFGFVGLFHKHDRDAVLDRVDPAALGASQAAFLLFHFGPVVTRRAGKYVEQILANQ